MSSRRQHSNEHALREAAKFNDLKAAEILLACETSPDAQDEASKKFYALFFLMSHV